MTVESVAAAFAAEGGDVLVASDFDGTLAPIVADPAAARLIDGAFDVLAALAATVAEVAVISGRPLSFLAEQLPEGLTLVGLYGLESSRDGVRVEHPNSGVWRETMADVATAARRQGPDGMLVELKELSITLHYREHPEIQEAVHACAEQSARSAGLRVRPARQSVELHPPIDEDKGTALTRLAEEHGGPVMFIGDDFGDLAAFAALDDLAAAGRQVLKVAADSDELPPEMRERADLVVDGPAGVLGLLTALAG